MQTLVAMFGFSDSFYFVYNNRENGANPVFVNTSQEP
mgnify:CR=1 FL=1